MASHLKRNGTEPGKITRRSDPSFSDFPPDIAANILARVPLKKIFACIPFHKLLSQTYFARLHFSQAHLCPLIQMSVNSKQSRVLRLVQPEDVDFEQKLEPGDERVNDSAYDRHGGFEIGPGFKLYFKKPNDVSGGNAFDPVRRVEGNNRIEQKDREIRVVNSCNGLLCLSNPSDNDPRAICNPVTGEFVSIPKSDKVDWQREDIRCGFGFSPTSKKYKVVRMYQHWTTRKDSGARYIGIGAEVHTLGTETWEPIAFKDIDFKDIELSKHCDLWPTYLNGFIYWPHFAESFRMLSFDVEKKSFSLIPVPPMKDCKRSDEVSVGVLGKELCISCFINEDQDEAGVWVLKDNKVWSKVFTLRYCHSKLRSIFPCEQIKYLNDGAFILLYYNSYRCDLIYKHPGRQRIQYFMFCGERIEVLSHIPSFVPLEDALSNHDGVNVLSRPNVLMTEEDRGIGMKEMYELKYEIRKR